MAPLGRTIRIEDEDYPAALRRLRRPPPRIDLDGDLRGIDRAVGIVGTRRATRGALEATREMARTLAELGIVIVSGGAEGIDAAAHEGALDADHGRTIAVLPTALVRPYPRMHAALFARIAQRGARLSEHTRDVQPTAAYFVQRNRIIAALSRVVIVVQAPARSGALRTAADARALQIPVLAMPWSPTEPKAAGGLALLADGARLCRDANDVLKAIGESPSSASSAKRLRTRPRIGDDDDDALLGVLEDDALDRDTLFERARLTAARGQSALARLLLADLAWEDVHGVRRR